MHWGSAEAQRQPPCEVLRARRPPARCDRHGPSRCAAPLRGRSCLDTRRCNSEATDCDPLGFRNASSEPRPRRWSPRRSRPWPSKNVLFSCRPGTEPPEPLLVARARGREDAPHRKCARAWTGRRPRIGAGLATRRRLLLVMLASPCRTSELLARARAASGRGAVPGRRRADVADVDTVDARCPRLRRQSPRLRGATGPRRAASRARLGCPLACGGSFEEAASPVLTGLPRGNAERPSERARASNAARFPPSTASEKVTPHFPSCRALH